MGKICEGAPQAVWDAINYRLSAKDLHPQHVNIVANRCYQEMVWCVWFYYEYKTYHWYFKNDGSSSQEP